MSYGPPTAAVGFMAVCLTLVAVGRRSWLLGAMAAVAMAVSVGLGYEDGTDALALVRGAGKQGPRYTTERGADGRVELGRCEVTIPVHNGRAQGDITVDPAGPGTFTCLSGQTLYLVSACYSDISLTVGGATVTDAGPVCSGPIMVRQ